MAATPVTRLNNVVVYLGQTLVTTLIPFVVLLVAARYITPAGFGAYALSQVYAIVATGFFSLGLHVGYERNYFSYAQDRDALGALHNSVLCFVLLSFSSVGIMTLFFASYIADLVGIDDRLLLLLVLAGQSLDRIAQFYLIYFRNSENAGRYSRYVISAAVINAVISLTLVVGYDFGVLGLAIGYALAWLCVISFMFVGTVKEISLRLDWSIFKDALHISLPVTPRTLVVIMGTQSDKYILGLLGSIGGVGIYNIAYRISSVINSYMIALQNAYTPMLYKMMFADTAKSDDGMGRFLSLITYFSILPAIGVALFAFEIVWLLLPPAYAGAAEVLLVLAVYYGVVFFGKIAGVQLIYAKKTGLTTLLAIVFALLNIALNIPLILLYGVIGAAIATLLTGSLYTLASYFVAQKYCHIDWEGGPIAGIVSTLLISGLIALMLAIYAESYSISVAVRALLLLFYGYLGIRLGFLSRANLHRLFSGLKSR